MAFAMDQIERNRRVFADKISAYLEKMALIHKLRGEGTHEFLLIDVRGWDAYRTAHIPGAIHVPFEEIDRVVPRLSRDRALVTYCWNDY